MDDQKVKGQKNGLCNRTACQSPYHVVYYNQSTRAYYCSSCAKKINDANRKDFGGELCILEDEPKDNA